MPKLLRWGMGAAIGYGAGLFYTGQIGYGIPHSAQWIDKNMDKLPQVKDLRQKTRAHEFVASRPWQDGAANLPAKVFDVPGGLGSPLVFEDQHHPGHTVTFTYAGGKTCGFPFIVHGGVLGTLLQDAFTHAAVSSGATNWGKIEIVYRKPTFSGQFLMIETHKIKGNKLEAVIYNGDGKRLVQAVAI